MRTMVDRLADDHRRAGRSGRRRRASAGRKPVCPKPETNIVTFASDDADAALAHLPSDGVLAGTIAPGVVRFVTHHDVDDDGVEQAGEAIAGPTPGR